MYLSNLKDNIQFDGIPIGGLIHARKCDGFNHSDGANAGESFECSIRTSEGASIREALRPYMTRAIGVKGGIMKGVYSIPMRYINKADRVVFMRHLEAYGADFVGQYSFCCTFDGGFMKYCSCGAEIELLPDTLARTIKRAICVEQYFPKLDRLNTYKVDTKGHTSGMRVFQIRNGDKRSISRELKPVTGTPSALHGWECLELVWEHPLISEKHSKS